MEFTTYPHPDLTGSFLVHNGDPSDVAAARSYVEEIARGLKIDSEPRSLEEIRADVALDLLQGKCVHQPERKKAGRTNLTVPFETLLGLSDAPGELEGYGPVLAELARKTALDNIDGEWSYTVTDNGRPVATGTLRRRPTASQRRYLEALYPTCVFSGLSPTFRRVRPRPSQALLTGWTDTQRQPPRAALSSPSHDPPPRSVATAPTSQPRSSVDQPTWAHLHPEAGTTAIRRGIPPHRPYVATRPLTINTPSSASCLA